MDEQWDLEKMEKMKDDCLEFLRVLFFDFYENKYAKRCTYVFLMFHVPIWAEQYYQYFMTSDPVMMAQYAPASFVFLYAFICMTLPTIYQENIRNFKRCKMELFWSLNTVSYKLRKTILKQANYVVFITKINMVLGVLTYISYLVKATKQLEGEVIYQVIFFKKYFPHHANILIIIFYASLSYIVVPMFLPIIDMLYSVTHIFFQTDILCEYISRISENYPKSNEPFYDKIYQKQVFQRMRFCNMRGMMLRRISSEQIVGIRRLIVVFTILGMLLVVSLVASWKLIKDKYYPSLIMLILTSGFTCLIIVEIGQRAEEKIFDGYERVCELPWYTFNLTNQKIFLCIITYSTIPIKFSPFRDLPVNRTLVVNFYKVAYSAYTLFVNVRKRLEI